MPTPDTAEGDSQERERSIEGRHPARQTEFAPWREEELPAEAASELGHRRIVKKGNVRLGRPKMIKPEFHIEPEPHRESVEITPLKDKDEVVGLRLTCSCGAVHEVRFEFTDEA
ncbi:MAG: hypothetical protein V3U35_04355 [Candidatus Neomarinimicrobiota bacterium]